ncbi:MAG TPA: hydratase [Alphaproteobacteria bacterium]|nr:hydratase [Alphaproteobacteria bacterium]
MRLLPLLLLIALGSGPALGQTKCGPTPHAKQLVEAWMNKAAARSPGKDLTMDQGVCTQAALVAALSKSQGKVIGYKAGLTSKGAQDQLGVPNPVLGVLLSKMILPDGSTVAADFGPRPLFEADMLVTVRDEGINQARTVTEVVKHLSTIQPFIELPDLVLAQGEPMTGPVIVAINVGARMGVVGDPAPVLGTPEFVNALAEMQVTLTADGAEISKAPGKTILGHPLNAVLFISDEVQRRGGKLKAGDILSLGSFSRLTPPKPGQKVVAKYEGLPTGPMTVSVAFK